MIQLVSWNVNGLRACVKKGFLDVMEQLCRYFLYSGDKAPGGTD